MCTNRCRGETLVGGSSGQVEGRPAQTQWNLNRRNWETFFSKTEFTKFHTAVCSTGAGPWPWWSWWPWRSWWWSSWRKRWPRRRLETSWLRLRRVLWCQRVNRKSIQSNSVSEIAWCNPSEWRPSITRPVNSSIKTLHRLLSCTLCLFCIKYLLQDFVEHARCWYA